jgi:nucleotide-binding universal stress UspA family protein
VIELHEILLATDFSEPSAGALEYSKALARAFGARIHVLHVLEDLAAHAWTTEVYVAALPGVHEEMERQATERLAKVFTDEERKIYRVRTELRAGSPFVEVVRYAREEQVDLIVMGTHGRGPLAHMLLGSVAERVVRKASCPVLTVRHADYRFVHP